MQTDYLLSKRTDLYVETAFRYVGDTGHSGITADIVGLNRSSNSSQFVITAGMRHRF